MSHTFDINTSPLTTAEIQQKIKAMDTALLAVQAFILGGALLAWICGVFWLVAMSCAAVPCAIMLLTCSVDFATYEDVEDSACVDLLEACAATPEGQSYRLAVIEQGRKFVNGELAALHAWAESASARAACKKLYDVPTGPAPDSSQDKQAA